MRESFISFFCSVGDGDNSNENNVVFFTHLTPFFYFTLSGFEFFFLFLNIIKFFLGIRVVDFYFPAIKSLALNWFGSSKLGALI